MSRFYPLFSRWAPAILMIAAIFLFSSIPARQLPRFGLLDVWVKKGGHALGYAFLAVAFWHGFKWDKKLVWLALLLAMLYATTDELHQSLVPRRHPSPVDVWIDSTGAAIALLICAWVRKSVRLTSDSRAMR